MLSKAVSTVLVNSFWLLKKWPDSKNRNSRPKLEKLGATIYAEALGDFASHIESWEWIQFVAGPCAQVALC